MYVRASVLALISSAALVSATMVSAALASPVTDKMAVPHTAPTPPPPAAAAETAAKPTAVAQTVSAPASVDARAAALKKRIADAIAVGDCDVARELAMRGGDAKTMADTDAACKAK